MTVRAGLDDAAAWAAHGFTGAVEELTAAGSLPRAWAARWAEAPGAPALADAGGAWVGNGELEERTARVAARFAAAGVAPGERVLMSCPPSVDLVVAHVAALRLGAVVVPVNTGFGANEIGNVWRQARPVLAVLDDPARLPDAAATTPDVALPDGPPVDLDRAGPGDPALLVFTSGTTGTPKGVVLSHGNLLSSAEGLRHAWRWTPDDRLALTLPLFHMHGLGVGVHGTLLAGASARILPFSPEAVAAAAEGDGATLFFGVPTMYVRLAASPAAAALGRLRLCVSGSAPLDAELWRALEQASGQRVLERYGMTETVMNVSNPYDGDRRPGSVGLALPGVQVRLAGEGPEPGEVLLQGPNVARAYWERPDATAAAFDEGGWFLTGDIGAFDPDGYLRIVGRSKELIITGGYNVYPREVEEVLDAHPAVAEAAVVGEPSAEWGERVVAVVVARDAVDEAVLLAWCADRLASYKRPRAVRFVDALPRNALGKLLRAELLR